MNTTSRPWPRSPHRLRARAVRRGAEAMLDDFLVRAPARGHRAGAGHRPGGLLRRLAALGVLRRDDRALGAAGRGACPGAPRRLGHRHLRLRLRGHAADVLSPAARHAAGRHRARPARARRAGRRPGHPGVFPAHPDRSAGAAVRRYSRRVPHRSGGHLGRRRPGAGRAGTDLAAVAGRHRQPRPGHRGGAAARAHAPDLRPADGGGDRRGHQDRGDPAHRRATGDPAGNGAAVRIEPRADGRRRRAGRRDRHRGRDCSRRRGSTRRPARRSWLPPCCCSR